MKKSSLKLLLAALVGAGFSLATFTANAEPKKEAKKEEPKKEEPKKEETPKEQVTLTGAAKAVPNKTDATKKHLELTDKSGTYLLLSKKITAEEIAKYDGKKVTVKGSVKEKDGRKTCYVSEIEEAK